VGGIFYLIQGEFVKIHLFRMAFLLGAVITLGICGIIFFLDIARLPPVITVRIGINLGEAHCFMTVGEY
jgi:hypothetical protein